MYYNEYMRNIEITQNSIKGINHEKNEDLNIIVHLNDRIIVGCFDGVSSASNLMEGNKYIQKFFFRIKNQ